MSNPNKSVALWMLFTIVTLTIVAVYTTRGFREEPKELAPEEPRLSDEARLCWDSLDRINMIKACEDSARCMLTAKDVHDKLESEIVRDFYCPIARKEIEDPEPKG